MSTSHLPPLISAALEKGQAFFSAAATNDLSPEAIARAEKLKQEAIIALKQAIDAVDASGLEGLVVDKDEQTIWPPAELSKLDATRHGVHLNVLAALNKFK